MPELLFPSTGDPKTTYKWNGRAFVVDGREVPVLAYDSSTSGWTDELTSFHEETAGDNHYIDIASRKHTTAALRRSIPTNGAVIIDIGCSSGSMLRTLRDQFPRASLIGADYISGPLPALAASLSGIPFLQFNLVSCPLFSNSIDAAILLNVLEHIEDDLAAIQQVFRILRPGGIAVIEVPAGPHLFDVYDKQLMHFRRYTLNQLCGKLQMAGFRIEQRSHLGAFVYPAFVIVKKRNQRYMQYPDEMQRKIIAKDIATASSNPVMNMIMRAEEALRPYVHYPAGIRCLVTCRKPIGGEHSRRYGTKS